MYCSVEDPAKFRRWPELFRISMSDPLSSSDQCPTCSHIYRHGIFLGVANGFAEALEFGEGTILHLPKEKAVASRCELPKKRLKTFFISGLAGFVLGYGWPVDKGAAFLAVLDVAFFARGS